MAYAGLDDIRSVLTDETLIALTDDEGLNEINAARVEEALSRASAEIDAWCGGRYAVPFSNPTEIIRALVVDMCVYNLYSRRVEEMPQIRNERHRNAQKLLDSIARGVVSLGESSGAEPAVSGGAETSTETDNRVFSRESMGGF